jgi:hypothetical protein
VAWRRFNPDEGVCAFVEEFMDGWQPLYTTPQPQQEPVKMVAYNCLCGRIMKFESVNGIVAPQREWVGLTDEEIALVCAECAASAHNWNDISFAHAIEAKLKEKNSGKNTPNS